LGGGRRAPDERPSAAKRGYDARWRRRRRRFLASNPLCASCLAAGRSVAAVVVDHVVPWDGDRELFEDEGNWQGLCVGCHKAKTGRERGGGAK
jgi:5-methylcytosine-specific restriction protein A